MRRPSRHAPLVTTAQRVLAAALLVPALTVLGACSASVSTGGYDPDDVAKQVQEAQEDVTPDLDVTDASCPDESEPEEGDTTECTVEIDGVEAAYTVTFTEVTDDGVNFEVEPVLPIVLVATVVETFQTSIEEQGFSGVEVDCGEAGVVVQEVGSTFTCDLTADGATVEGTVTIDDADGNVSIEY
ncbi:hypothetical protein GCM10023146_08820 [Nocardioides caricicola]